jgi:hypothetical protein
MRISEDARKCVVFFGTEAETGGIEYRGTGSLVCDVDDGVRYPYLVTCRHAAKHLDHEFYIRANKRDGTGKDIEVARTEWLMHPDENVDLAIKPFVLARRDFDQIFYDLSHCVAQNKDRSRIMAGDEVSVIGLFHPHSGKGKNIPVVHTGHIAVMPDPLEPVPLKDDVGNAIKAISYLIEAQTLDGLSGSPVFMRRVFDLKIPNWPEIQVPGNTIDIMGIYQGSWDGEPGVLLATDRKLSNRKVPVGMGLVIPIERLLELTRENADLKKMREKFLAELKGEVAATTDFAAASPPANDANPNHREDFTHLLNAAARKPERED